MSDYCLRLAALLLPLVNVDRYGDDAASCSADFCRRRSSRACKSSTAAATDGGRRDAALCGRCCRAGERTSGFGGVRRTHSSGTPGARGGAGAGAGAAAAGALRRTVALCGRGGSVSCELRRASWYLAAMSAARNAAL